MLPNTLLPWSICYIVDFYQKIHDELHTNHITTFSKDHAYISKVLKDFLHFPLHETEDFFVGLDQPIQVVVVQNNVNEEVTEEVIEMANDQAEALSSDQEVTDEYLDDEQVEERRPSKRIRVTQEEMVKDEKPKKG
ncbi:hypothetical protein Tco_0257132 [Tanacetum coccineum]